MIPRTRYLALTVCATALFLAPSIGGAQDSSRTALPAVSVTATREGPRAPLDLPYAITLTRPDALAAMRKTGVDELLFAVPGVALASRQNPAQDPCVSIRGFGARSAFGVRGVRVLQDGVPVTLPDGQTPVDALDLEGAERIEVVRGSAGRTLRRGGEVGLDAESGPIAVHAAYTYSRFRYVSYVVGTTSYAGRRIPGVAQHALMTSAIMRAGVAIGRELRIAGARLAPLVAVQNIGGVRSAGSVSVNATEGKFYEPAPGRTVIVRLALAREP